VCLDTTYTTLTIEPVHLVSILASNRSGLRELAEERLALQSPDEAMRE
jgi:hypothetical protein